MTDQCTRAWGHFLCAVYRSVTPPPHTHTKYLHRRNFTTFCAVWSTSSLPLLWVIVAIASIDIQRSRAVGPSLCRTTSWVRLSESLTLKGPDFSLGLTNMRYLRRLLRVILSSSWWKSNQGSRLDHESHAHCWVLKELEGNIMAAWDDARVVGLQKVQKHCLAAKKDPLLLLPKQNKQTAMHIK